MAVNIVLPAGLLVFFVSAVTIGTLPSVPDGIVYTEVKKTLVRGLQGKLTCRFYGEPWAVYWKKGNDPMDRDLMLVWHTGDVSGPRYNDGSCDIDDTFSLIIHNVSMIDAGRIYCIVSNYQGILLENYTDLSVTDTAIDTKAQVILEMGPGRLGILQCTVHIKARRVSWRKVTSLTNESLVVLENNNNDAEISGLGYKKGMYNITKHYSLVIKNLQVRQEGLYVCEVTDFDTGMSFRNHTFVSVIARPLKPFPTIQECMNFKRNDSHYCTLDATSEITLTCQVMEYYPEINLFFLHGSKVVEPFEKREWSNTDGTKSETIKIAARESKELFTCVASHIPGSNGRMSTSVLLHPFHDEGTFNSALVAVLVCFAAVILFSSTAYCIRRRRRRHSDNYYTPVEQIELHVKDVMDVKDLTEEERKVLQKRVDDALMKHYRRIYHLIDTKSTLQAEKIINENKTALFDNEQMFNEWQQNEESTFRPYMETMQIVTSKEDKSDHAWPSNEELRWISRLLDQESMKEICKKLKITCKTEDNDIEEKRYNSLREWRNKVAKESVEAKHKRLSSAIGSMKLNGLLPALKGRFIYKAELVDMAFNLLMSDLLPVAEALGINATKLVSYRPAFQPSHLQIGTIDLLSKLLNSAIIDAKSWFKILGKGDVRGSFCSRIEQVAYRIAATCGMVAYDMSYGELYAISEVITSIKQKAGIGQALPGDTSQAASHSEDDKCEKDAPSKIPENERKEAMTFITEKAGFSQGNTSKAATHCEEDKCEKGATSKKTEGGKKEETDNEKNHESETPLLVASREQLSEPDKAIKDTETKDTEFKDQRTGIRWGFEISEDLFELRCVLQLTDQDIADGLGSSYPITAHALIKIWKEKPRPSVFNFRAAFAHGLHGIHLFDLADDVIAGKYITQQTSLTFIQNMVRGLTRDQLRSLGELLKLSEKDEQWHTTTPFDEICKQIYEWVATWTKEMRSENFLTEALVRLKEVSKKHRDLNDKLVEQSFLDLAREVMIIEQQIK